MGHGEGGETGGGAWIWERGRGGRAKVCLSCGSWPDCRPEDLSQWNSDPRIGAGQEDAD